MKLSKTQIKQYCRCSRSYPLDKIYCHRLNGISPFEEEKNEITKELLSTMFDSESADDLINVENPQMEALLPYYNMVEEYAMQIAKSIFGESIIYSNNTMEQYLFSFNDQFHQYYCYLDGYQEKDDDINIFEVKATTSKKFAEYGPCLKNIKQPLFQKKQDIYQLRFSACQYIEEKKYQEYYEKLFNRYSEIGKYVYDMAIERYIIEHSPKYQKNKKYHYYLVVLNHEYVFDGTYLNDKMVYNRDFHNNHLVVFIDLNEITAQYQELIKKDLEQLKQYISIDNPLHGKIGRQCEYKKITECLFVPTCFKEVLKPSSIIEYRDSHHGFTDEGGQKHSLFDLIEKGKYFLDSIPTTWLTRPINLIQRQCHDKNEEYIDYQKIHLGLGMIKYPIYHLDFESFPSPLPRFAGEKAYNQSLFQFSIHVEKKPGLCHKEKSHIEYLAASNNIDCREQLIQALIDAIDLKNGGTVLVYNMAFEKTRIKELSEMFPVYARALEKINEHMFDLLDIIKGSKKLYSALGLDEEMAKGINYYHNALRGSFSIKKVLPLFSDLSYQNLTVANGTDAIASYAKFDKLPPEELKVLRYHLKKYCQQDTWSMVLILRGLRKKIKKVIEEKVTVHG